MMSHLDSTSVVTIDCYYLEPGHAAAYLLVEDGRAAFIENNTVHAVPLLLDALAERGLAPEQVDYIIITHLHLDHGGGTSALVRACPNAAVLCHPRAERHLIEPERLIAGAKMVYGEDGFERMYAPIDPIDPARIRSMADGEAIPFGNRTLTFLHTLGHAKHHMCIHDSGSAAVFTGDSFGVNYKAWRKSTKPFLICSCAPTDFDPIQARASARRILDMRPDRLFPTHFGELTEVSAAAEVLNRSIDQCEDILNHARASGLEGTALQRFCEDALAAAYRGLLDFCGVPKGAEEWGTYDSDLPVNAQGIACIIEKERAA